MWLALASVITGVWIQWSRAARPLSLVAQLSPWLVHAWGVLLAVGGVATLAGRWRIAQWRPPAPAVRLAAAFRLEVAGMVCMATAVGVYSLAILAAGRVGLTAGSLTMAQAWACAVRARIVSRQLAAAERSDADG